MRIHGRLSPGVSVAQASVAVGAFTAQLAKEHPATNASTAGVVAGYDPLGNLKGPNLPIIMAVYDVLMAIPLLVVCLNVSGMVQVRSAMRERELSIRQAIGASRRRLIQYLLAEAVVLAALGSTLAALVLVNIPPVASWLIGEPLPAELQQALRVDFTMLALCAGLCLATSLVFGWLPAIRFSRPGIMTILKDDAGGGRLRAGRVHRVTSALQVAIAVPLLVVSAMSLERVRATARADLGFAADSLYAAPVEPGIGPKDLLRRVRAALASASGVASVTVADGLPLDFRYRLATVSAVALRAMADTSTQTGAEADPKTVRAQVTRVDDRYLDTMGIALLGGRSFTSDDAAALPW